MESYIAIGALVVAIVALGYSFYVKSQTAPVTAAQVVAVAQAVPGMAAELEAVANIFVYGNEQRRRDGKITKSEAYDDALNSMRGWAARLKIAVPFTNDQIIGAVNKAILGASAVTSLIAANKAAAGLPVDTPVLVEPALPARTKPAAGLLARDQA